MLTLMTAGASFVGAGDVLSRGGARHTGEGLRASQGVGGDLADAIGFARDRKLAPAWLDIVNDPVDAIDCAVRKSADLDAYVDVWDADNAC